jgi:hypothetical protein
MSQGETRQLVVGQVGDDRRHWIGVEGDETAYDRLESPLTGRVTHALVIGDRVALQGLVDMIANEYGVAADV